MNMKMLTVINDAVGYVRSHPEIFFQSGLYNPQEVLLKLVTDAISLGCTPLVIDQCFGFWVISANKNWVDIDNPHGLEKVFSRLTANPKAGQNASRSEVLLNAFAENVIFMNKEQIFFAKGNVQRDLINQIRTNIAEEYLLAFN